MSSNRWDESYLVMSLKDQVFVAICHELILSEQQSTLGVTLM